MYTDEDLNYAVEKGVFTGSSVEEFRSLLASLRNSPSVDEENFKLVSGFNDIFVLISCTLVLASSVWFIEAVTDMTILAYAFYILLSWLLAEFFVLKRRMALPAIALLFSFVGGVFTVSMTSFSALDDSFTGSLSENPTMYIVSAGLSALSAYLHWLRFKVPITVAVGVAAGVGLLVSIAVSIFPDSTDWLLITLFVCGVLAFVMAMYWDASDLTRTTRNSDVAFWLHLLSAPLIIHPVFSTLGVFDGNESIVDMAFVVILYLLMTTISIVIDRRAFMVSSLIYVLYAISSIIKTYGGVGYSFALTGVVIGTALLLLSVFWHPARGKLIKLLPEFATDYVPQAKTTASLV